MNVTKSYLCVTYLCAASMLWATACAEGGNGVQPNDHAGSAGNGGPSHPANGADGNDSVAGAPGSDASNGSVGGGGTSGPTAGTGGSAGGGSNGTAGQGPGDEEIAPEIEEFQDEFESLDLFAPPENVDYTASPDNHETCPDLPPENPWGDCVGVPVYGICDYTDYVCICDWYHWICLGPVPEPGTGS